ncbi:MAG: hypothetical protein ACTHMW_00285 [Actinomycetes bacterium]
MTSSHLLPPQPPVPESGNEGHGSHLTDEDLAVLLAAADDTLPPLVSPPHPGGPVLPPSWWDGLDAEVLDDPDLPGDAVGHASSCGACQRRLVALAPELAGLSDLLGAFAETPLPDAPELTFPAAPLTDVTPLPSRRRRAAPEWLRAAAVVVAIAAVGAVGFSAVRQQSEQSSGASGVFSSGGNVAGAASDDAGISGGHQESAAAAAGAGSGSGAAAGPTTLSAPAADPRLTHTALVASGTDYSREALPTEVTALLGSVAKSAASATPPAMASGMVPASVVRCLRQLAPTGAVAAVDNARFEGTPARVVVAGSASDSPSVSASASAHADATGGRGQHEVWVVTPDCGTTSTPRVLFHTLVTH